MKSRKLSVFFIVLYYCLIRYLYEDLAKLYGYFGLEYVKDFNRSVYTIGVFCFLISFLLIFKRINSFNWTIGGFVFISINVPMFVYYEYSSYVDPLYFWGTNILFIGYLLISHNIPKIRNRKFGRRYNTVLLSTMLMIMLFPFFLTYGFNFNYNVLLLEDIYDVRLSSSAKGNVFTGYFYGWLSRAVAPILLVYGLINKNKVILLLSIAAIVYLFLVAAHKSVFFGFFLVFFFYFIKGYERKLLLFVILLILCLISGRVLESYGVPNLARFMILYRFLFVQVELGSHYFDFFADNYTYWSQSPFNFLIDYPYNLKPAFLIANKYYNNPGMGANTGIVSEGFMNLGKIGIMINIFIFSTVFGLIGKMRLDERYFGVLFIFIIGIQNSAMNTVLLTHGLFMALLLLILFNLNNKVRI